MEESDPNCHVASLLAYHLVNLVLQEGCMIANAALESGIRISMVTKFLARSECNRVEILEMKHFHVRSGPSYGDSCRPEIAGECGPFGRPIKRRRPWEYLSTRVNVRSDLTYVITAGDDAAYVDTTVDKFIEGAEIVENPKIDSELLVTSTPQKVTDEKPKKENGQGDEYTEIVQTELSNSTSLFINHLFDITDVELGISDDANALQNEEPNELLAPLITNVLGFYMNAALDAFHANAVTKERREESIDRSVRNSGNSSLSYIDEALPNAEKDVVFYVEDDDDIPICTDNVYDVPQDPMTSQMALQRGVVKEVKTENMEFYENTYLSLNRDYEQCSDEDEYPILEDPKGMLMQEIALLTANTSNDTARSYDDPEDEIHIDRKKQGGLAATSGVSAGSRKSGLVQRWRQQGARFLASIRGWWRRKSHGKRKMQAGVPGSCARRTASLLDQRVSSPTTCHAKCNTISEALINSSHWMDYTFDPKQNDCGDV